MKRMGVLSRLIKTIQFLVPALVLFWSSLGLGATTEKVLIVSPEQTGVFNTGGLGHTVAGLAKALKLSGTDVEVLMPYYSDLPEEVRERIVQDSLDTRYSRTLWGFEIFSYTDPKTSLKTWLLKPKAGSPAFFENRPPSGEGKRYTNYENEAQAFDSFDQAAAEFIQWSRHTMINLHDWPTGMIPFYFEATQNPYQRDNPYSPLRAKRFLFTISNMGYQGVFPRNALSERAFPTGSFNIRDFEYYGNLNFLKAGITQSNAVLTVSPGYLEEIQTPRFGNGLEGLIREKFSKFLAFAITNGADTDSWDPAKKSHPAVQHLFSAEDLTGKKSGKALLQKKVGFPIGERTPLVVLTSRLAHQKGLEYLPGAIEDVIRERDAQILVVGDGEPRFVKQIQELAQRYPEKMKYFPYSLELEKLGTAYADFFLNTPWYEPSGTNQIFAMKNGTVPIVARVGGLVSYVEDGKTGFLADIHVEHDGVHTDLAKSRKSVASTLSRALTFYQSSPDGMNAMRREAMKMDFSWDSKVGEYEELFQLLRSGYPGQALENLPKDARRPSIKEALQILRNLGRQKCFHRVLGAFEKDAATP